MKEVILSLILMLFCLSLGSLASTGRRYISNSEELKKEQHIASALLNLITERMQIFSTQETDFPESQLITDMEEDFITSNLTITDVSSGINTRFFPENIITAEKIKTLLSSGDDTSPEVYYGWINAAFPNKTALSAAEKSFCVETPDKLFPLVNTMPLTNVYYLSEDCTKALFDSVSITNSVRRSDFFSKITRRELRNNDDIKNVLHIGNNAAALSLFGVKTSFWKVTFVSGRFTVTAVYAAVPDRSSGTFAIDKYILVEQHYAVS
jgi:hypothetical protein